MGERIRDSVEVALDLDEKSVYSHIAHESAEDMVRIISSIDAERARNRGEVIYYNDDWDDLIRKRIARGKRHTAFDFYNPALLDIWERKVEEMKRLRTFVRIAYALWGATLGVTLLLTAIYGQPWVLVGLSSIPLLLLVRDVGKNGLDFRYYQLGQFFIDELRGLVEKYALDPGSYGFKVFNYDYFGVSVERGREGTVAYISPEEAPGENVK